MFLGHAQARSKYQAAGCHQYRPATRNSSQRTQWSRRFKCAAREEKRRPLVVAIGRPESVGNKSRGRPDRP